MLVFYYHLVPELMPILWRAKLSCAIELGSTREKHIHKQQKKKREESGFRLLMASLLHVYVCMFVCEPVSIVFFFSFWHSYTVNQLGHRFRRFYSWFICRCSRSQTLRFFSPLLFFFLCWRSCCVCEGVTAGSRALRVYVRVFVQFSQP